jgi:PAS domain S-box-containing protein
MDYATDPWVEPWRQNALQRGYHSSIALPLLDRDGKAFGALTIYSAQPKSFIPDEKRLLEEMAGDLSFGIVSLRVRARQERMNNVNAARLRLLRFAATHSLDALLEETLNEAEALTNSLIGFYHFVEKDQNTLSLQNWSTKTKTEFCRAEGKGVHYGISQAGVWVDCVHQRRPVIHNDYPSLAHRRGLPPGHAEVVRELVVPVMRGDQIMAILGVGNKSQFYTQDDVEAVSFLADLAWDIVERKQSEDALRNLVSANPESLLLTDPQGMVLAVNQAAAGRLGHEVDEIIGHDLLSLLPPEVAESRRRHMHEALQSGQPVHFVDQRLGRHIDNHIHPIGDQQGQVHRLALYGVDITDLVQAQERLARARDDLEIKVRERTQELKEEMAQRQQAQEALARERTTFVSMLAHDMKTPLVSIQGFAHLLLKKGEDLPQDKRQTYQEVIARQSGRLEEMIAEFLEYSRLQDGHLRLNLAPTDLEAVLRELVESFQPRYQQAGIQLELAHQGRLPLIQADAPRLRRVFTNLLENALRHSPAGSRVNLQLRPALAEVLVSVRDQGAGIPPEDLPHIFEPFYRGASGRGYQGHGLGLSGVEAIVKGHGGQVLVESILGQGSCFTVVLPDRSAQNQG